MRIPQARGPLSGALIAALQSQAATPIDSRAARDCRDPLADDDLQVALWVCYELHYRGFDEVDPQREWDPEVIRFRRELERVLLTALRREVAVPSSDEPIPARVQQIVADDDGPSLSRYLQSDATAEQFREFVVHRSLYQLKEADPHSWAIPRLAGAAKVALVEIQFDEYGAGRPSRMHSELYRTLMRSLELDDSYAGYVDQVTGLALAISNVMSLFGLRRELRGALVGQLAAYEMTSSAPCRRYAKGLRRLGGDDTACEFYDAHVVADALHEQIAAHDLCGGLAADHPELSEDIVFGAATSLHVDGRFAEQLLATWSAGESSLRTQHIPTVRTAVAS